MIKKRIVFLHLPRTGGVTLNSVLKRQYGNKIYFTGDALYPAAEMDALSQKTLGELDCLAGHFPFGFGEYLLGEPQYITILRDPVDRIISHYHSAKEREWHHLHDIVLSQKMSIIDYVSSGITLETSNSQTQLLSGVEQQLPDDINDPISQEALEKARDNLSNYFTAVGIFERYDESVLLFKRKLGWENITYYKENKTIDRPLVAQLSKEEREVIKEHNRLDIELYQDALSRFTQAVREEDQDGSFSIELGRYQIANRRYQRLMALYWKPRKFVGRLARKVQKVLQGN